MYYQLLTVLELRDISTLGILLRALACLGEKNNTGGSSVKLGIKVSIGNTLILKLLRIFLSLQVTSTRFLKKDILDSFYTFTFIN